MARIAHNRSNLIGKTFGKLTVIAPAENTKANKLRWLCKCVCGEKCIVVGSHLRSGHTVTCGHLPTHCIHGHLRSVENTHPDGTCKVCVNLLRSSQDVKDKRNEESRSFYAKTSSVYRKQTRERMAALKLEVLTYYSPDHILGCCWESCAVTDLDMLSLDHINNDGAEHRRKVGKNKTGEKMYRLVKQEGFPESFQTLCMNHQTKKKLLNVRSKQT